jgi:hypothetical protein
VTHVPPSRNGTTGLLPAAAAALAMAAVMSAGILLNGLPDVSTRTPDSMAASDQTVTDADRSWTEPGEAQTSDSEPFIEPPGL